MQHEFEPSPQPFRDSQPAPSRSTFGGLARFVAARLTRGGTQPIEQPFRDSDFESEPDFLGRPLGDH